MYSVGDRMINECEAVDGMENLQVKPIYSVGKLIVVHLIKILLVFKEFHYLIHKSTPLDPP
jgi:hypothetical protein